MAVVFHGTVRGLCYVGGIKVQARGIAGKVLRQSLGVTSRPAPFPYMEKRYSLLRSIIDRTTHRFDMNSKVVVVDGPISVGKTAFAAKLAEELDMRHFPEANMDLHYIDGNGFDRRTLDPKMPESCRTFDHVDFCKNPNHLNATNFQVMMYNGRYDQYIDALAHLLNTGQGVILERSPYSDFVFAEAMVECGFMSKLAYSIYEEIKSNTISQLRRPHLAIYLDISTDVALKRIKTKNLPHEVNSPALTSKFLSAMERSYKEKYLKQISDHAEILIYDWTDYGDVELVVDDIEKIDFDCHERYDDNKLKDWKLPREMDWAEARMLYTNSKYEILTLFNVPRSEAPELMVPAEDTIIRDQVLDETPETRYAFGFNPHVGDKYLFKYKGRKGQDTW